MQMVSPERKFELRLVAFLRQHLAEVQSRQPRYSLRAFARDVGVPAPVLSEVLRGKRAVTRALAEKICAGLALATTEAEHLMVDFRDQRSFPANAFVQLDQDVFSAVSDWHYFAILSLAELDSFRSSPRWVAARLGVTTERARAALATLARLGLLEKKKDRLVPTGNLLRTSSDIPHVAIQKNHLQGLELAKDKLRSVGVEHREFSANTIALDATQLAQAKEEIREWRRKFSQKWNRAKKKNAVYRLQLQFFPLTNEERKDEK